MLARELQQLKKGKGSFSAFEDVLQKAGDAKQLEKYFKNKAGAKTTAAGEPFPEDFIFKVNEIRSEDLEVEERAMLNLMAAEYDAMRVISKLPTNSELYRFKVDQYKELSTMRAEVEKVLQEQKLEKIRRDFEKQKYNDERTFKHDQWLEDQKRKIMEAKLTNKRAPPPPSYVP